MIDTGTGLCCLLQKAGNLQLMIFCTIDQLFTINQSIISTFYGQTSWKYFCFQLQRSIYWHIVAALMHLIITLHQTLHMLNGLERDTKKYNGCVSTYFCPRSSGYEGNARCLAGCCCSGDLFYCCSCDDVLWQTNRLLYRNLLLSRNPSVHYCN